MKKVCLFLEIPIPVARVLTSLPDVDRKVIAYSSIPDEDRKLLQDLASEKKFRSRIELKSQWDANVTHLIVGAKHTRTMKVLQSICNGAWILKWNYINKTIEDKEWYEYLAIDVV